MLPPMGTLKWPGGLLWVMGRLPLVFWHQLPNTLACYGLGPKYMRDKRFFVARFLDLIIHGSGGMSDILL